MDCSLREQQFDLTCFVSNWFCCLKENLQTLLRLRFVPAGCPWYCPIKEFSLDEVQYWIKQILTWLCPASRAGGIKRCNASDVCLSVAYIGHKSRTERPRKTKIGTSHVIRTSLSRWKGQLAWGGAYCGGLPHRLLINATELIFVNVHCYFQLSNFTLVYCKWVVQ